jgi:hypothetical protein
MEDKPVLQNNYLTRVKGSLLVSYRYLELLPKNYLIKKAYFSMLYRGRVPTLLKKSGTPSSYSRISAGVVAATARRSARIPCRSMNTFLSTSKEKLKFKKNCKIVNKFN